MTGKGVTMRGRGGQPPKMVMRTRGGWVADYRADERARNEHIADATRKALNSLNAPEAAFAPAFTIMRTYHKKMEVFDNPSANADKNAKGVGRFKDDLRRRAEKMANQLEAALQDEASHDLSSLISEGDVRSHMQSAYDSLTAIVELIDRAKDGDAPLMSQAQIRKEAGRKLKALAKEYSIRVPDLILSFGVYTGEPTRLHEAKEQEAFEKWLRRLDD